MVWSVITTITSAIHPKIALKTVLSQINHNSSSKLYYAEL